ncbi:hypothetical protein ACFY36_27555 [Actinoplanes sp. NPDC000266]
MGRRHDSQLDKGLDGSLHMPRRHAAAAKAVKLEERHRRDGTAFPDDNPSSGTHLLLASVEPGTSACAGRG